MKTATLIRDNLPIFAGHAALYRLSEPITQTDWKGNAEGKHEYVIVSATSKFTTETYIFPADADGSLINWGELEGSMKDTLDHAEALRAAGYEVTR